MAEKQTKKKAVGEEQYETLIVHSAEYKTLLTKGYKGRKSWEKANPMHEKSYIPGTLLKMYVSEGQEMKKGEPILILEAMKMENTIFAPFDCKIAKINVAEGDILPKGTLMIEYA